MANHLLCFGSDESWWHALDRTHRNALAAGFDTVSPFDVSHLRDWPHLPWARTEAGRRGFGYWGWKPWLALRVMAEAEEGDTVTYSDVGSFIRPAGWASIWLLALETGGVFYFHQHPEVRYCKADLWAKHRRLPVSAAGERRGQIWAGCWTLPVNDASRRLLQEWAAHWDDHHLVDDSPSVEPNHPEFVEHRHDQSVLSLLVKARGPTNGWLREESLYTETSHVYPARTR